MKTLLFCTSLLENESLPKYAAWWKYYKNKFPDCDFMILNDGPVDPQIFDKLKNLIGNNFSHQNLITFDNKLGRNDHLHWGWYRSFRQALMIGQRDYDRIIHIEADALILSDRLFDFIRTESTGWKCMYTKKYLFPESAIQIINKDSYHLIDNVPEDFDFHKIVELMLPFQSIKAFIGDRYGEIGKLPDIHHILKHYDSEKSDYTIFLQGDPFPHLYAEKDSVANMIFDNSYELTHLYYPLGEIIVCDQLGRPLSKWKCELYSLWDRLFEQDMPYQFIANYGAQHDVHKSILQSRSKRFWERAQELHFEFNHTPWAYEILWYYIFDPRFKSRL